eukprot:1773991-Lingulodinium_polyedra.AAC.1
MGNGAVVVEGLAHGGLGPRGQPSTLSAAPAPPGRAVHNWSRARAACAGPSRNGCISCTCIR